MCVERVREAFDSIKPQGDSLFGAYCGNVSFHLARVSQVSKFSNHVGVPCNAVLRRPFVQLKSPPLKSYVGTREQLYGLLHATFPDVTPRTNYIRDNLDHHVLTHRRPYRAPGSLFLVAGLIAQITDCSKSAPCCGNRFRSCCRTGLHSRPSCKACPGIASTLGSGAFLLCRRCGSPDPRSGPRRW